MLHICTPLYRFDNVKDVYMSLPKSDDVMWHVSKSSKRTDEFWFPKDDPRVKLYVVDTSDSDTSSKRNVVFDNIHDGWFHLLDDDTYFMKSMYKLYEKIKEENYVGMVNGRQTKMGGGIRLYTLPVPMLARIDTGNVLCHHSVLRHVKWGPDEKDPELPKDFVFWKKVYNYFGELKQIPDIISIYNALQ